MTKTRLVSGLFVALSLVLFASPLLSQASYNAKYVAEFVQDDLSFDKLAGYDRVRLKGGDWLSDIAKPMLPAKELRIALPAGMKVTDVYATDIKTQEIIGEYNIFPAQPPKKISFSDEEIITVQPDQAIYASSQPYPSKLVELIRQTDLAGQGIAVIRVYPLQYIPAEKKLTLYTSLNLVIEGTGGYECGDYLPLNISEKDKEIYEQMVKEIVVNPEDVQLNTGMKLGKITALLPGSYAHVIITSSTYAPAFQPLVEWHTKKGVKDTVVYAADIYANYSGATNQEKIRNFIIDAHST
ncbi:MAG: C25 family cysteine peptidase, partial [candidate division Zixibacteria bacterium]|nr:C25 family cysteine peptidase [candidate division Zixibacteria bacterium]